MTRRNMVAWTLCSIVGLCVWQSSWVLGEEGAQKPRGPKTTAFTGILEDMGATWIKVKVDGPNESMEFKAEWVKGSKPLKADEELFKGLKVGAKVEGEWRQGDAARFCVKIKMVDAAAEGAKPGAEKKEERK